MSKTKVKFIKRHFSGIEKGTIIETDMEHVLRLEEGGFVERVVEPTKPKRKPATTKKTTRKPAAKKVQTKEGGEIK